jgi:hypothetical protein
MIEYISERSVREASDALGPSTVAAHVVLRVTCHQRHWRQHHVCFALGCDGEAVREDFGRAECPAAAAAALVADGVDELERKGV